MNKKIIGIIAVGAIASALVICGCSAGEPASSITGKYEASKIKVDERYADASKVFETAMSSLGSNEAEETSEPEEITYTEVEFKQYMKDLMGSVLTLFGGLASAMGGDDSSSNELSDSLSKIESALDSFHIYLTANEDGTGELAVDVDEAGKTALEDLGSPVDLGNGFTFTYKLNDDKSAMDITIDAGQTDSEEHSFTAEISDGKIYLPASKFDSSYSLNDSDDQESMYFIFEKVA